MKSKLKNALLIPEPDYSTGQLGRGFGPIADGRPKMSEMMQKNASTKSFISIIDI